MSYESCGWDAIWNVFDFVYVFSLFIFRVMQSICEMLFGDYELAWKLTLKSIKTIY